MGTNIPMLVIKVIFIFLSRIRPGKEAINSTSIMFIIISAKKKIRHIMTIRRAGFTRYFLQPITIIPFRYFTIHFSTK